MGQFRGVVTNVGDAYDSLRLYRLDEPGRFVQFSVGTGTLTEETQGASMLPVHVLDIAEDEVEDGFDDDDDIDGVFAQQAANSDDLARAIVARDPRDPGKSEDGSAFRCCHTLVYC